MAWQLMGLRRAMELAARHFNTWQNRRWRKGKTVIADALPDTLREIVGEPMRGGAAILQGVHEASIIPLAADRWLIRFDDGPPARRAFGDLTMLAIYEHGPQTLTFLWCGIENEVDDWIAWLRHEFG